MTYSPRTGTFGISHGWKVPVNSKGQPSNAPISLTGLISSTGAGVYDTVNFNADETVVVGVISPASYTLAVSQYQFNHDMEELSLHGYNYVGADYAVQSKLQPVPYMFYFIRERTDGTEELVMFPFCTALLVNAIGDGSTVADTAQFIKFDYTAVAQTSPNPVYDTLMWTTTNTLTIENAKNGIVPAPTGAPFTLNQSLLNGVNLLA